jgi:hypothetical protein
MTRAEGEKLIKGQAILLNEHAEPWTRGKVFYVDTVKPWGVKCWAHIEAGEAHVLIDSDQAFYRAPWHQVAGRSIVSPGLAASDLTGGYPD